MKRGYRACGMIGGVLMTGVFAGWTVQAAEHGGHEHGGAATQEPSGSAAEQMEEPIALAQPSPAQIRQTIRDHISKTKAEQGSFQIKDPIEGKTRTLELIRVHDRVGKTGELYYSCTDMKDTESGQTLDLDFDVSNAAGELKVVDVRIHKVDGKARYTYDDKDNRIPVQE